ncbi:MAG: ABC transporter ATP-binding protein [Myxococcales bacterium]|nr:ABC transporter ATP-binding protein/permease [Polyangiaceae bacterium]MDW8248425.1 ABC transporter ATP-binding protein [Myxococcales bacterium]
MQARFPTSLAGQLQRHAIPYLTGALLIGGQQGLMFARDWLFKLGVDAAVSERAREAVQAALTAVAVVVLAAVMRVLSRVLIFDAGRSAEYELRAELLAKLHQLGTGFTQRLSTGDILSRSTNDLSQVRLLLGFGVLNVVNTMFSLASALSLMIGISGRLTLAALAPAPLLMLVTRWFSRQVFLRTRENQEALGMLSGRVQASLAGIRVIRALSLESSEERAFEQISAAYLNKSLSLARLRGMMFPLLGAVAASGVIIVFWYGGTLVLSRQISHGDFVAFSTGFARLVWPLMALGFVASTVQRGRASYLRLREVFDANPEIQDGDEPVPASVEGALEVRNLSFRLGERTILDGVSFHVSPGSSLAIVGRTGSGKSTLAALLARLLPTPSGAVFLDGRDITRLPLCFLRRSVGYAQQDAFLFSTTVARNIAFCLDDPDSDEALRKVREAASEAQILTELEGLPEGLDTVVGERGVQLSGGQRQRVALARAFLAAPPILVLDDPLSAVDARTEAAILDAIERQKQRSTVLLITHRVAAAARCHRVIVLEHGKVAEEGTHNELLLRGGLYTTLAEEQRREQEMDALRVAS